MKWQNISLPIQQGVDTKTDEKALPAAKLANLENGVFTKGGTIIKRPGYTKLDTDVTNMATAPTGVRGLHSKDEELLLADDERLFSYASATDQWVNEGRFKSVIVTPETVADRSSKQSVPDCATVNGVTVYAWQDSRGGVYISVINEDTGAVYRTEKQIHATALSPRCIAVGREIHVYCRYAAVLYQLIISPYDVEGTVDVVPSSLVSDLDANAHYDTCEAGDSIYLAYHTSHGSLKLKVLRINIGGGVQAALDYTQTPTNAIAITREPNSGRLCVIWHENTAGLRASILDGETLVALSTVTLDGSSTNIKNIAAAFRADGAVSAKTYAVDLELADTQYLVDSSSTSGDSLDIGGDITIECLVRFESVGTNGDYFTLVSRDDNAAYGYGYYLAWANSATDSLMFGFRRNDASGPAGTPAAVLTISSAWTPVAGTWYHVAVTRDRAAGEVKFYANGVLLSTTSGVSSETSAPSDALFRIGARNATTTWFFDGLIDEVRVWSSVRTIAEIVAARTVEIDPLLNPQLAGYWRLNNDYTDLSGNLHALSPINGPVVFSSDVVTGFTGLETEVLLDHYDCKVFYELTATADYQHKVYKATYATLGEFTAGALFKHHSGIASRAWVNQNDVQLNLVHASAIQTTYFTYMDDGTLIAKMGEGVGGGLLTTAHLPNVQSLGDGLVQWMGTYKKRLASDPDTAPQADVDGTGVGTGAVNPVYTEVSPKRFRIDHQSAQSHQMVQVGRTGYFNGGQIWQYDSHGVTECGFHIFPEKFFVEGSNGSGALTSGVDYWYKVYAVWVNANGERERSTVASAVKCTMGVADDEVKVSIYTLSHTNKTSPRSEISFEVYRTVATPLGNSPFYKVTSDDPASTTANNYTPNNPSSANGLVVLIDRMNDATLIKQEVDYQNSGALDNTAPTAASIIAEGKDRIWLAGFEDTSEIRYSKQHFSGEAVNFNDALTITIPEDGGAITGLRVVGNTLIIFKRTSVYGLPGDGPNNLGFGQFGAAQLLTNDVGCIDQRSIAATPLGLMFQSEKGIYLLTGQFQALYIGAEVEAYNSQTITDAVVSDDKNHVTFLTSSGRTLLYDYLFKQWSTFTNHEGMAAAFWDGRYCYGRTNGVVYVESDTLFTDVGAPVKLKLETAWVKLNTLQGFQRIRRAMVLGEFRTDHRLALDIAYDYEDFRRRLIFDAAANVDATVFGDPTVDTDGVTAFLGDGTPFGSGTTTAEMGSSVYQFRAHLPVQKCQSVKFFFEDLASVGQALATSYEITELMLEVGVKRGTYKPADTRSI